MEFIEKFGPWVIVTGASSGIGRAYAEQLAYRGLNIVLVARSVGKLNDISEDLRVKYSVETRVISLDLSRPDSSDVVYVRTIDLDVGLLISNAGFADLGSHLRHSINEVRQSIQLNVAAHVELTHYMGKRIRETREGRGGILLMSSVVAMQGVPYLSLYAAAKAYLLSFGEALHYENKKYGLHVSVAAPGPIDTPMMVRPPAMNKFLNKVSLPMISADDVVMGSLLSLEKNAPVFIPNWRTRLRFGFFSPRLRSRQANVNFWGETMKKYMRASFSASLPSSRFSRKPYDDK